MIVRGMLMLADPQEGVRLAEGWLRITEGRIEQVEEGACPHDADLGGDDCLVLPGFIDAHLHLPQFDSVGSDGLTLLDWLASVIFPAEMRWADAAFAAEMTGRVIGQLLGFGTTGFAAYATVHHAAARAALETAAGAGVRAAIGQVMMDQEAPQQLLGKPADLVAEAESLLTDFPAGAAARVAATVTPRFAVSCSAELLAACGDLAARHPSALVQTHLAETQKECQKVYDLHQRKTYAQVYRDAGLLGPRTLAAHGVWLDAGQRQILAETDTIVAHCPTANTFLASGTMDHWRLRTDGVRLCLGSDVAGGPDRSMPRVARAMIESSRSIGRLPPTAAACWAQMTAGNADALGWADSGRLEAGAWADVLVVRPDLPWRTAPQSLSMLLYGWDERWLKQVIVAGRVAVDNAL
ncbi:MAG: amidohydrolase family protein [Phycisphaerae bacterium]|nr:amidohydrolase family protein [Phycisphaerae bacterium]